MTKILIKTYNGRLMNFDNITAIEPGMKEVRAYCGSSRGITMFYGEPNQIEAWMKAFNREFECASNLPTYVIDVNDEAKGAK